MSVYRRLCLLDIIEFNGFQANLLPCLVPLAQYQHTIARLGLLNGPINGLRPVLSNPVGCSRGWKSRSDISQYLLSRFVSGIVRRQHNQIGKQCRPCHFRTFFPIAAPPAPNTQIKRPVTSGLREESTCRMASGVWA